MSHSLTLLGGLRLTGADGPLTGPPVQRHRLALLAVLAVTGSRGVSRDKLMSWLWPERDGARARGLLNQSVHAIRRALGDGAILSEGDELRLDAGLVVSDVAAFEAALVAQDLALAVSQYTGPLLDGFFLADAPEFERWVERERERLSSAYAGALEELASDAERVGDAGAAVKWWKARAAHDPYDSRVAVHVMRAVARAGNRAGALQHGAHHEQMLRTDLELDVSPEMTAEVERIRKAAVLMAPSPDIMPDHADAIAPHDARPARAGPRATQRLRRASPWGIGVAALTLIIGAVVVGGLVNRNEPSQQTAQLKARPKTTSIAAHELYVRGSDPALLRSDSGAQQGLEYFRRALALDSMYAAAWAGLARMKLRAVSSQTGAVRDTAMAAAETAARRSVALDDSLAEAHAMLGMVRAMSFDLREAEPHFRRAIALEPNVARHREWASNFYILAQRPVEALAEAERALALDPLSATGVAEVARALLANNRCDEALARIQRLTALDPPLLRVAPIAAHCYGRKGRWSDAIAVLKPQAARNDLNALAMLGYMHARAGHRKEAAAIHAQLLERWRSGRMGAYYLAFVPTASGDYDAAFAWLDRSVDDGSLKYFPSRFKDPPFDDLARDGRLDTLRRRIGLRGD